MLILLLKFLLAGSWKVLWISTVGKVDARLFRSSGNMNNGDAALNRANILII